MFFGCSEPCCPPHAQGPPGMNGTNGATGASGERPQCHNQQCSHDSLPGFAGEVLCILHACVSFCAGQPCTRCLFDMITKLSCTMPLPSRPNFASRQPLGSDHGVCCRASRSTWPRR